MKVLDRARGCVDAVHRRLPFGPRRHHPGPLPYVPSPPSLKPVLPVADMALTSDFYRRLGFEVVAYDDGYAWVKHCGWEYLHIRRVDDATGNQAGAYVHVEDADEWHRAMTTASDGSIEIDAPADTPWGMREFSVTDPSGNLVRFGQHL